GRVGRDHRHAQLAPGTPHWGQAMGIDFPSRFPREPEMAAPIAIPRTEHSLAFDPFLPPRHDGKAKLFLAELRVVDLAGGSVQNYDPVIPALVLKPRRTTVVDVQPHARQGPALAMPPAFSGPRHSARPLECCLDPGVAQINCRLLA